MITLQPLTSFYDWWALVKLILWHRFHMVFSSPLARSVSYLVQFSWIGCDCKKAADRKHDSCMDKFGEWESKRGGERATFEPESLMSFLTRFEKQGKSSIRKIVSFFHVPRLVTASLWHTTPLIQHIHSSINKICSHNLLANPQLHQRTETF